ncbi:protein adenylyltransferase SelO family protein [Novosphingobium sp.]|uniref:protein adenylyltransferase SelO family protein n=1 Tax=Novosphingobium sp. TaxID=1874826 RepID=UPI0022CB913A|nr:YdiU family protein [Novosphingobium sp.]MCZ8019817.1 YdiU family protein [Novosphingobium sp.]MCZ8035857.1 YdiU family protein [Novosphingobium sp.]MCZ8052734.1 YdiU family protein [Novosphingobium sp.]MCZ8060839.1 YdiU family protein [Novosphingobium sp.]MCZ8233410.1 YdiU family protein [Novosphingobium sp.]
MRAEPQASPYQADTPIAALAPWLGDPVAPAPFPQTTLRWRNRRWDSAVGLDGLSDADWVRHMGWFEPLPGNLPRPLALRYHGHQFRVYNPDLGDGRGFLFAQLRDGAGRLLDLGTKGSGQTPWSRDGDGRLTLKGAVREILATEMLEALGVNTSKTFSVIETGEELYRSDEPSPTRSAVLVRLSHGHIRIGTFQRLAYLERREEMEALIAYCLEQFPGPPPPADAPGRDEPAAILLHQVVERLARLAAEWMAAGFVHGVLNTDNMNISGESFDYGPWRWLPKWDPSFTAAYFDHGELYAFGRQPEALHWNCGQLAVALRLVAEAPPLIAALERFGPLYQAALAQQFLWRLGVASRGFDADYAAIAAAEKAMRESGMSPDAFFHRHRFGRHAEGDFAAALAGYAQAGEAHPLWDEAEPPSLVIDRVEAIWAAIDQRDDWSPLAEAVTAIRRLGEALGPPCEGDIRDVP